MGLVQSTWIHPTLLVRIQNDRVTVKTFWQFLIKLSIHLPYDLASPYQITYCTKMKTYVHITACVQDFIVAFFVITENNLNIKGWVDMQTTLNPYNRILYSNKRKKLLIHATIWVTLFWGKKASKSLHPLLFYLYNILEMIESIMENRLMVMTS